MILVGKGQGGALAPHLCYGARDTLLASALSGNTLTGGKGLSVKHLSSNMPILWSEQ